MYDDTPYLHDSQWDEPHSVTGGIHYDICFENLPFPYDDDEDGSCTVFVKIFLLDPNVYYHVYKGGYFSHDLEDGQIKNQIVELLPSFPKEWLASTGQILKWGREVPIKDGHYWVFFEDDAPPNKKRCIIVRNFDGVFYRVGQKISVDPNAFRNAWWYGPLPQPPCPT